MSFFKGLNYIGHQFINTIKRSAKQIKNELNDESIIHCEIQKLTSNLEKVVTLHYAALNQDMKKTVKNFLQEINLLLDIDSKDQYPHFQQTQYHLAKEVMKIINRYRLKLEIAPGLWNQIKACANIIIENLTGKNEFFITDKTFIYTKSNLVFYKQRIKNYIEDCQKGANFREY